MRPPDNLETLVPFDILFNHFVVHRNNIAWNVNTHLHSSGNFLWLLAIEIQLARCRNPRVVYVDLWKTPFIEYFFLLCLMFINSVVSWLKMHRTSACWIRLREITLEFFKSIENLSMPHYRLSSSYSHVQYTFLCQKKTLNSRNGGGFQISSHAFAPLIVRYTNKSAASAEESLQMRFTFAAWWMQASRERVEINAFIPFCSQFKSLPTYAVCTVGWNSFDSLRAPCMIAFKIQYRKLMENGDPVSTRLN